MDTDKNTKLISCPFCNGKHLEIIETLDDPESEYSSSHLSVICANCRCQGPSATTTINAKILWNNRGEQNDSKNL